MIRGDQRAQSRLGLVVDVLATTGASIVVLGAYLVVPLDGRFNGLLVALVVVLASVSLIPMSVALARRVLVSERPLLDAGRAIFTWITLLTVSFASLYYVLGTSQVDQFRGIETKLDAIYFTVTLTTTVGFGDIVPVGQAARGVVTAHMVVNFVLLAAALRVLSWAVRQRSDPPPAALGDG